MIVMIYSKLNNKFHKFSYFLNSDLTWQRVFPIFPLSCVD